VTRTQAAPKQPFHNAYWDNHADGVYFSVCSDTPLFDSRDKFESGTAGRVSQSRSSPTFVADSATSALGWSGSELHCAVDGAHLGHVFDDGPGADGSALLHQLGVAALCGRVRIRCVG